MNFPHLKLFVITNPISVIIYIAVYHADIMGCLVTILLPRS